MLPTVRPITWSLIRYRLSLLQRCCSTSPMFDENTTKKHKWVEHITTEHMLKIEEKWKDKMEAENATRSSRLTGAGKKYYVLSMFPYPSGKLHMGHVRVYVISDLMARYHRMLGHEVIHPMGWDAFGLPAENAAIRRNLDPKEWTYSNIETMKSQMNMLSCSFDWDREVVTCDPAYYKWTQHIFLKMFEKGLVYQKEAEVNWDPVDKTVLADEQVDDKGRSWRSGALVEKRYLNQWYIRTTQYSQSLLDGLDTVRSDLWRDVIQLQRNWIGQMTGCRLNLPLLNNGKETGEVLSVYTEHPECIHGASFIALSWLHPFNNSKYHKTKDDSKVASSPDLPLTLEVRHPTTGGTIPLILAAGTADRLQDNDCFIGMPCLSNDDREIAERNSLPWLNVVIGDGSHETLVNSAQFDGLGREEAREAIMKYTQASGFGGYPASSHLKDWLISRQRYWGTPIPVVHCATCKVVPVPLEDLPVQLPDKVEFRQQANSDTDQGDEIKSPLYNNKEWLETNCPKCGGPASRETDTMDTFVDSSWYFFRYLDNKNEREPVSRSATDAGLPVDLYIGGKEHAYMHLYYARFFSHFLCDSGLSQQREPFVTLLTQGLVKNHSYKLQKTGMYVPKDECEKVGKQGYKHMATGEKVVCQVEKMSKSKYNGVDPEDLLARYGIDLTRLTILANVAPKSDRNWDEKVYHGVQRWTNRVWSLLRVLLIRSQATPASDADKAEYSEENIRAVRNTGLIELRYHLETSFLLNVPISRMQEYTSYLKKVPASIAVTSVEYERAIADLIIMMAPFSPMFASELWTLLMKTMQYNTDSYDTTDSVLGQKYPVPDPDASADIAVTCYGEFIGKTTINYSLLDEDSFTKNTAISLIQAQDFYQSTIGREAVTGCKLTVSPRFRADVDLIVPALKDRMVQVKQERQREVREKQKKKKQAKNEEERVAVE